ncbi:MAG: DNA translocase FtsK 4TM domain-containing protein, partial [Chloroflexota bacterium]
MKLPVIPPDALFSPRVWGILLCAFGGFTLVALFSPGGTVTQDWADQARAAAGWAAAPWCAVLMAAGLALHYGRRALRRAVAGRLVGATLMLLAAAGFHQLVTAPPAPGETPASVLAGTPGVDGYLGLAFGAALAAWFGTPGAVLLLPLAMLGFGLLCGWRLAAWQRLAQRVGAGAARVGRQVARAGRLGGR